MQEKRYNSPDSFLVVIKNQLCRAMGIDNSILVSSIDRFVNQTLPDLDSVKKRYIRTNIFSEFAKDKMTVKVFFKFLRIINIKKIKFNVTVINSKDSVFEVEHSVDFFVRAKDEQGEEDDGTN